MSMITRLHDSDKTKVSDIRFELYGVETLEQVESVCQKLGAFIQDKQLRVMNDPANEVVEMGGIK